MAPKERRPSTRPELCTPEYQALSVFVLTRVDSIASANKGPRQKQRRFRLVLRMRNCTSSLALLGYLVGPLSSRWLQDSECRVWST